MLRKETSEEMARHRTMAEEADITLRANKCCDVCANADWIFNAGRYDVICRFTGENRKACSGFMCPHYEECE